MLVVDCPINNLSFGNVSYNILRELYRRSVPISLFLVGDSADLSAFDKTDDDFKNWIENSYFSRYENYDKDAPCFKLWHINGSIEHKTREQNLLTFYECSQPTAAEVAIVRSQRHTMFSSSDACSHFTNAGAENCSFVPMGFDPDLKVSEAKSPEAIHFTLIGKLERRKRTAEIMTAWLKKYGNRKGYQLNLLINNPFLQPKEMNEVLNKIFGNQRFFNVNILPHLKKNSEVCQLMNVTDIDLSGLSGGEGWNLPAFNSTCLGKWSIVSNNTSHKDWANKENSILIEPEGIIECYDGKFFRKGDIFNQGHFYRTSEETIIDAMEQAEKKVGTVNSAGLELQEKFSYKKTVDHILASVLN